MPDVWTGEAVGRMHILQISHREVAAKMGVSNRYDAVAAVDGNCAVVDGSHLLLLLAPLLGAAQSGVPAFIERIFTYCRPSSLSAAGTPCLVLLRLLHLSKLRF